MKRLAKTLVLAWAWTILYSGAAHAQPPAGEPWTLSLGAGSTVDGNLTGSGSPGVGRLGSSFQASLGRSFTFGPRGSLGLSGTASEFLYGRSAQNLLYGFGATGSYAVTRRLAFSLSDSLSSSYAQDSKVLIDAGVVLPNIVALSHSASTQLTYAMSPRTHFNAGVSASSVGLSSLTYSGGANISAIFGYGRRLTQAQTLNITQGYQRTHSNAGFGEIQAFLANWQMTHGRQTFSATTGIQPYKVPGHAGYKFSPGGGAAWSMSLNATHTVGVGYERTIEQALDRTHLVQAFSGTYGLNHGRISIGVNGSYARGTYPVIQDLILIGELINANFGYRIGSNLSLSVAYGAYYHSLTPDPGSASYRTSMGLSYGTSW